MLNFKITNPNYNNQNWFLHTTNRTDHSHPISYRLVVLHCIYQYLNNLMIAPHVQQIDNNQLRNQALALLFNARNIIFDDIATTSFFEEGLFAIYKFQANGEIGAFFVDRSRDPQFRNFRGVFPLIFYPDNYNSVNAEQRFIAIRGAVNDVTLQFEQLYFNILINHLNSENSAWNVDIQIQLAVHFTPLGNQ